MNSPLPPRGHLTHPHAAGVFQAGVRTCQVLSDLAPQRLSIQMLVGPFPNRPDLLRTNWVAFNELPGLSQGGLPLFSCDVSLTSRKPELRRIGPGEHRPIRQCIAALTEFGQKDRNQYYPLATLPFNAVLFVWLNQLARLHEHCWGKVSYGMPGVASNDPRFDVYYATLILKDELDEEGSYDYQAGMALMGPQAMECYIGQLHGS